ncbi:MAG: hypothetical protein HY775_11575 [Acidobacteria bacterium]|nr:hypothetical protein [Acidobacteriota bacterium]
MKGLRVLDELVAGGTTVVTPAAVQALTGQTLQAAVNMLGRLVNAGLLDRVARGRYVVRPIGLLATSAAAEDVALAVGAVFSGKPHRIAYRSALEHHGLLVHAARAIQVASASRVTIAELSGRPLRLVLERQGTIGVGATRLGDSWVSDVERALIDAAARPDLVGGAVPLAEALLMATPDPERMLAYGRDLAAGAAIRRIGSVADQLRIGSLAGGLRPVAPPTSDITLDTSIRRRGRGTVWRDRHWFVRWPIAVDELVNSVQR